MLRDYEILYIVRPDLDEEKFAEAVGSVDRLIGSLGGSTVKTDVWGRRRLAYEVRHLREGQYVLTDFQIDPQRVPEMEATLKISDSVFRHLIVRKPEKKARQAAAAGQAAATEQAEQAAAPEQEEPAATSSESGAESGEGETAAEEMAEADGQEQAE